MITEQSYWDQRYINGETGWDIGHAAPPITEYFDKLENKAARILIPGCGNAYEAEYLHKSGFANTFVLDISPLALKSFSVRYPEFPKEQMIQGDFFSHDQQYDFIVEQTFFCAIEPDSRQEYANKSAELLNPGGKLVGVLFDRGFDGGPPFGGNAAEYQTYFENLYHTHVMETCVNSIKPREGTELFILLEKKSQ